MSKEASSYTERQSAHDTEYVRAWENAPKRFKRIAAKLGIACEPEHREGMAIQFEENYVESSYKPDMASAIDDYVDRIVEELGRKYGWSVEQRDRNAIIIKETVAWLKRPMQEELIKNRAFLLGRVACYLIKEEGPKILPRVHALLHSIPGLAKGAGYGSLRASAVKCRVSAEWLRRRRDKWCHVLSIPIPTESRKSTEAREKYRQNACLNHWRTQKYKQNGNHNGTNGHSTNGHTLTERPNRIGHC